MAERMKNIAGLFKEGRTRLIVLTTLIVLLVAIIIGIISIRNRIAGPEASAGISQAPNNIQSVPFQAPNEEYARLQEQQNTQQAKKAEQVGASAIPTIIRGGNITPENAPVDTGDAGPGFTALSREQSDAGTFNPKTLNTTTTNCVVNAGAPVYDAQGNLIGYVGADGKVRGLDGKVIGSVDPDGTVRDANGNILGKVSNKAANLMGTPVYDANGRLIGYADANGKVHDLNGNLIGTVGSDGVVRDAKGNVIGQVGNIVPGTPVYDDKGNLIGYVGADGKVRDATGRIIGTVGPDGAVRDPSGKIVGRVATPVYDAHGKLLGFAGADGKVRDANGNIIGTVGPDGVVRDSNGNVIGKAGAISPGSPIYDANGRVIGTVGPDGRVRDANGNVIGIVGPDGLVRDANGNIVGSTILQPMATSQQSDNAANTQAPVTAQSTTNPNAAYERQLAVLRDQNLQQAVQQRQQAMSTQANQLLAAWTSPTQQFVTGQIAEQMGNNTGGQNVSGGSGSNNTTDGQPKNTGPVFIKAGSIYYAVINTAINSDQPGPVMATIISGPYKNSKVIGTLTNQGQAVLLAFNTMSIPTFPQSVSIDAIAIDQNTARTALSTYTNNHYWMRYGSVFAAAFIQGYGQAFSQSGSSTATNGLTTQTSTPDLSGAGKFYVALGNVGTQFSNQLNTIFNTPPTVYVASGTAVGLLFQKDVQMPTS